MGLVSLKNLLEEGFDAVGLERNDYLGGLWQFDEGEKITVLESESRVEHCAAESNKIK